MSELCYSSFVAALSDAIKRRRPFSFVRCGDGEGIVIGYPEYTDASKCIKRLHKWCGTDTIFTNEDLKFISMGIRNAIRDADIVGLPGPRHDSINTDWRNVKKYIVNYGLINDQNIALMDYIIDMQKNGDMGKLLRGNKKVILVTCRNVRQALEQKLEIGIDYVYYLPPQANPNMGRDYTNGKKHWPDLFNGFKQMLEKSDQSGKLFLIGAGGLGKIYCSMVKKHGGVAFDIGSLFDGWAKLITRSYLRESPELFEIKSTDKIEK